MPPGIGYPDAQDLTNSAIDDLLDDDPRKKRPASAQPAAVGPMAPLPDLGTPPAPTLTRQPDFTATPGGPESSTQPVAPTVTPTPGYSLAPPTGALAPSAPPPVTAPPTLGSTAPRASSDRASTATNPQDAYNNFAGSIDPNAPQDEMEAAIEREFGNVPGYQQAYKESVKINGKWYDLVGGYGGPNAAFHGLMEKKGGKGAGFLGGGEDGGFGMGAIDDESRLDAILASIDAMARGEGSPLANQKIDALLASQTPGADPASLTPLVQQAGVGTPRMPTRRGGVR